MGSHYLALADIDYDVPTFVDLLSHRARNQPKQVAYTFLRNGETETQSFTYQEIHLQAQSIAARLQSVNAFGERALLLYQPGLDFIAAFFGCLYAGVIAVPAYPPRQNQNFSRLQTIVVNAQAKVVLTSASLLPRIQNQFIQEGLSSLCWFATDQLNCNIASVYQPPNLSPDTLAFLQYTSGSTGNPKGVMVNHSNLLSNSEVIYQLFGNSHNSRGMIWLPPYHDMGLIGGILQPLYAGFPVILMASIDFLKKPIRWLKAIDHYKVTTSGGPNFAYDHCLRKVTPQQLVGLDLSTWEVAFTGAETIRAETLDQFTSTFAPCGFRKEAFYPCYGMAEATLIISGGNKADCPITFDLDSSALEQNQAMKAKTRNTSRTLVGCGQSPIEQKIVIVHPDSLIPCLPGHIGEIWVAGPSVAQGYWNEPEETEKYFQAFLAGTYECPFMRTGDLGFLEDRELFVTGRIKDVIIIRGQNHYPQDIELTAEKSHLALKAGSSAAFTVEFKGCDRLVIVQEVERSYLQKLNVQEIVRQVRQSIAEQHGLEVFTTVLVKTGSLLKTSSGKIRRRSCRDALLAGDLEVVEDWSETPHNKSKFINLQAEVDSFLEQLTSEK